MSCEWPLQQAVPVTLISGFLGAGKTTLLNHILSHVQGVRMAVLVNDFGAINIDSELIVQRSQTMMTLANGCMCCTVESDLISQLEQLLAANGPKPEHLLIEASGLSNPQKIASTLRYPQFRQRLRIDAIVTLVDAEHYASLPAEMSALAQEQLDAADIIVLNKTDRISQAQLADLKAQWLYPDARLLETQYGQVSADVALGHGGSAFGGHLLHKVSDNHDQLFVSHSFVTRQEFRIGPLRRLLEQLPVGIYRAKGVLHVKERPGQRCLLHHVGNRSELTVEPTCESEQKPSQLVFIGLRADFDSRQLEAALQACLVA